MNELFTNSIFIQALGFVAFSFGVSAVLSTSDTRLKYLLCGQCIALTFHFILLGAFAGAAIAAVHAVRNFLSARQNLSRHYMWFIAFYLGAGIYTYDTWVDALPIISAVIGTYGLFKLERLPMRFFLLAGTILWLIHNVMVGSIGASLMELVMLFANLRTIRLLTKKGLPSYPAAIDEEG